MKLLSDCEVLVSLSDYIVALGVLVLAVTLLTGCSTQECKALRQRLNPIVWDI